MSVSADASETLSPVFVVSVCRNHNPVSLAVALDMRKCTEKFSAN